MGRQTRYFRQSKKSLSGSQGAQQYAQINRGPWHSKVLNWLKVRGKREDGKS